MDMYISWDYSSPGISFNIESGRITIFKRTLEAMGYPEYFRFLFDPDNQFFGVEPCGIDDDGANWLPDELTRDHYDIKSKNLVRFVYKTCGWEKKLTYRIAGTVDGSLVYFDLQKAYEIHEGRMLEAERQNGA